jgi:hypothetical protein
MNNMITVTEDPVGTYTTEISKGVYEYKVSKRGYNSKSGDVTVEDNDVVVPVVLTKNMETEIYEPQYDVCETKTITTQTVENARIVNAVTSVAWGGQWMCVLLEDYDIHGISKKNYDDINALNGFGKLPSDRMGLILQPSTTTFNPYFFRHSSCRDERVTMFNRGGINVSDYRTMNINFYVDVKSDGEHWLFIGADNYFKLSLNGVVIIDRSQSASIYFISDMDRASFLGIRGYKLNLMAGENVFSIDVKDASGGPWGFHMNLYNIIKDDLIRIHDKHVVNTSNTTNALNVANACRDELLPYMIFSTWRDIKNSTENYGTGTFTYTFKECPDGYVLNIVDGNLICQKDTGFTGMQYASMMFYTDFDGNSLDIDDNLVSVSGKNPACACDLHFIPSASVGGTYIYNNITYDVKRVFNSLDTYEFYSVPVKIENITSCK